MALEVYTGALEGPEEFDAASAAVRAQYIGDAVRLCIAFPRSLRVWAYAQTSQRLVGMVQEALDVLEQASADPPAFVRQRDRLESLRLVLRLITINEHAERHRGATIALADRASEAAEVLLDVAVALADSAIVAGMGRAEVEMALGERWGIAEEAWAAALPFGE